MPRHLLWGSDSDAEPIVVEDEVQERVEEREHVEEPPRRQARQRRPQLIPKDEIPPQAVHPEAEPKADRHRPPKTHGNTKKAKRENLKDDYEWFMEGCPDDNGIPLRRQCLSEIQSSYFRLKSANYP